jgi:hypothetical protein
MALTRATRAKLVWALELALGLELYACAVLALHARGLRVTPILASPGLVIPALVIPPVFYVLVSLVSVRPLSVLRVGIAASAMCAVHAVLVMATGALFVIPDLVDYGAAVAFSLWGSPAVTMLQLTAAPLVLARLRPLIVARPGQSGVPARRADVQTTGSASTAAREPVAPTPAPSRENAAAAQRPTAVTPRAPAPAPTGMPIVPVPSRPASVVREPTAPAPPTPTRRAPMVSASEATPPATITPVVRINATASPLEWPDRRAGVEPVDPRVRVAFSRVADQLPVEMFARGAKGLSDMLRPGVSLFVPRSLLLPHLAEGVAPVRWEVVADQFPRDELLLTNAEIAKRLPNGSLRLPLDEVLPQIPAELLALSKQPAVVPRTEELPPPVQLHVPPPVTAAVEVHEVAEFHEQELATLVDDARKPAVAEPGEAEPGTREPEATEPEATEPEATGPEEAEPEEAEQNTEVAEMEVAEVAEAEIEPPTPEPAMREPAAPVLTAPALSVPPVVPTPVVSAPAKPLAEPEAPRPVAVVVRQAPKPEPAPEPRPSREANGIAANHGRTAEARRIATILAPVMNGLEIGERDGAGTPLVTAIAPILSDDAVVATALQVVPCLSDPRLPELVSQATLASAEATIVLTPFGSPGRDALLVAAVASRGSLARLERLSRRAAGEPPSEARNEARAPERPGSGHELRAGAVPPFMRELAGSLTAYGPVAPAVLRDAAGGFRVCLFGPRGLEPASLAQVARDLFAALEGTKIGPVTSVILRLGTSRLVVRALGSSGGQTTLLVVVGSTARPGLARLELERAVNAIGQG